MIDAYLTLGADSIHRIKRKKSRFIAVVAPADSEERAAAKLASLRRAYHDATHHCHALRRLDGDQLVETTHDDGEPPGSAGAPILAQLARRELYNVLAVVIRYYGGSPLGVGGLIRAYSDAVSEALDGAETVRRTRWSHAKLRFPVEVHGGVLSTLHRFPVHIQSLSYEHPVQLEISVRPSELAAVQEALIEATGARVQWEGLS
jgi:uncharacterized YigZ family protein